MHWKTYRRLEARDEQLQNKWAAGAWGCLNRFKRA